jgi:hypothetical protein
MFYPKKAVGTIISIKKADGIKEAVIRYTGSDKKKHTTKRFLGGMNDLPDTLKVGDKVRIKGYSSSSGTFLDVELLTT